MSENKKIVNATPLDYGGIHFRSKLEVTIFKAFIDNGITPEYEPERITVWRGFKPSIPFYIKDKKTKQLNLSMKKQIDIHYTPDFAFDWGKDYRVYIEVKPQFENDVFPYKKKLFRAYLEKSQLVSGKKYIYAQLSTRKETIAFVKILETEYAIT